MHILGDAVPVDTVNGHIVTGAISELTTIVAPGLPIYGLPKYVLCLMFGSQLLLRPATSDAPRGREAYRDPTRQSIVGAAMFQPARVEQM